MLFSYGCISTGDQTLDLQKDTLAAACCGQVCTDMTSGAGAQCDLDSMLLCSMCGKATRSSRSVAAAPDRHRQRTGSTRHRVSFPHRVDRHNHARGKADLPS